MLSFLTSTTAPACLLGVKPLWISCGARLWLVRPRASSAFSFITARSAVALNVPPELREAAPARLHLSWREGVFRRRASVCVETASRAEFRGRWNVSSFEKFLPVSPHSAPDSPRRLTLRPGWKSPSGAGFRELPCGWTVLMVMGVLLAWYPKAGWGFLRDRRFYTDTRAFWSEAAISLKPRYCS